VERERKPLHFKIWKNGLKLGVPKSYAQNHLRKYTKITKQFDKRDYLYKNLANFLENIRRSVNFAKMEADIFFSTLSVANISKSGSSLPYYLEQERKSTLFKIWKNGSKLGFPQRYAHFLSEIKTLAYLYDIASC
jgi:hypothetical protein